MVVFFIENVNNKNNNNVDDTHEEWKETNHQ